MGLGLSGTAARRGGRTDLTVGSAMLHRPGVTDLPLQIRKRVDFHLNTSTFSAFVPQVSGPALPPQSSCRAQALLCARWSPPGTGVCAAVPTLSLLLCS